MEYSKLISISGLNGLFELVGSKNDGAIVKSLDDKTTKFVSSRVHNFSHLESIEVYTIRENVNLVEVFQAMDKSKEALPAEKDAAALGFAKVSQLKLAVAQNIKNFVVGGGFLFTMCSGTDSYDIALAAQETDICDVMYDHDPKDPNCQQKLLFNQTLAFQNFTLEPNSLQYEYSNIDGTDLHRIPENQDKFTLFDFSAKWDIVPTMLTQCHTDEINGFMGQTTDFRKDLIKSNVLILGETKSLETARYIHGEYGQGTWTFYGGHDPEDYQHRVEEPPTDLALYPNSAGYRLILNNVLFPAARKKHQKT